MGFSSHREWAHISYLLAEMLRGRRQAGETSKEATTTSSSSHLFPFLRPSLSLLALPQHFEEAKTLSLGLRTPNPRITSLRTQALNKLSACSRRPDLERALRDRRAAFLKECFPRLDEEDVEWEDESGSEEDEEDEDEEDEEDEVGEEQGESGEDQEMVSFARD